jgi:hypothetical protein
MNSIMPCAPSSGLLSFKHGKTFCFLLAPTPEAAKSKIAAAVKHVLTNIIDVFIVIFVYFKGSGVKTLRYPVTVMGIFPS